MKNKQLWFAAFCLALSGCAANPTDSTDKPIIAEKGMVLIPAGKFQMGSDKKEGDVSMWRDANALNPFGFRDRLYLDEHPLRNIDQPNFLIDKHEVTNAQYRDFAFATRRRLPYGWSRNGYSIDLASLDFYPIEDIRKAALEVFRLDMDTTKMSREELLTELEKLQRSMDKMPVTTVTWFDANDFCKWSGKRLPTEAEWEKAARGADGLEYPWGNEWDETQINTMSDDDEMPYDPVGSHEGDTSVYGVQDLAANVVEWVEDWYEPYPGAEPYENKFYGKQHRVARGGMTSSGHYDSLSVVFRGAKRTHLRPNSALIDVGFRCAK